jgi:hypothetical protein
MRTVEAGGFLILNVVAEMLFASPAPAMIWASLMLLSLPAVFLLASPESVREPRRHLIEAVPALTRHREERRERRLAAVDAARYAGELTVAAGRAGESAGRWLAGWQAAAGRAEAAWQRWQDAEQRLDRTRPASAFGMPAARTPDEYADRARFLHRVVGEAAARGDLPPGAGGWDPRLHPVDQERAVQRAVAAHLHDRYQRAAAAERDAWHDTRLASSARDSLRQEAVVASVPRRKFAYKIGRVIRGSPRRSWSR